MNPSIYAIDYGRDLSDYADLMYDWIPHEPIFNLFEHQSWFAEYHRTIDSTIQETCDITLV